MTMQINHSAFTIAETPVPYPLSGNPGQRPPAQWSPESSDEGDAPTAADAARVLLVDDSEATLARAVTALAGRCTVVGMATNGAAALDAVKMLQPDVIVLDISMPGMNGFELAKHLRAGGSTAALVFLTVHEEEELILAAKRAGAIGYVVKSRLGIDLEVAVREAKAGRPFQSPI